MSHHHPDTPSLPQRVAQIIGAQPTRQQHLHGGMIGEVYRLNLPDGRRVVAKVASGAASGLETEGYMLRYLAEHSALPVPQVLYSDAQLLLLSWLDGSSGFDARAQAHAAELLADLHNQTAPAFGMEQTTLIATIPQPNPWTPRWIDFFRDQRLLYMSARATERRRLPASFHARVERLAARLDHWLEEPDQPSLIHGDIWATNVLARDGHITGFIDPAIYYGHFEMELAYITLFDTFGAPFFERYHALRPIEPGFFEHRRHIYNLYPLLVHAYEFGGSYIHSVERTLAQFGC